MFYNFADINDHKKFPKRALKAPETTFQFVERDKPLVPEEVTINNVTQPFEKFLATNNTVAFMIIRRDTILYENYFGRYERESIVPSFSVAKSVASMLIGCALDEGLIKSVDEPVTNYIPEMKQNGFDDVTIRHVLQMTSGIDFKESYVNPFGHAASFYYGRRLRKQVYKLKLAHAPGTRFGYKSGNTQILGLILERALAGKTVSSYFQEKIWSPLGMEFDGSWSIDKKNDGMEKTFCCINARARDYAKLGRLYLHEGNWNGKQIVSREWVKESTRVDTDAGSAAYYQYQWWLPDRDGSFMAEGILGQFIFRVDHCKTW